MDLEQLLNYFKEVSLSHKDVNTFQYGNNYDIAANNVLDHYPVAFYELPYSITYDLKKKKDTLQFSYNIFLTSKPDSIVDDHQAMSMAKNIGDAILFKISEEAQEFIIESANAVSVRQFSDDDVSGIRYDLVLVVNNTVCDYKNLFN